MKYSYIVIKLDSLTHFLLYPILFLEKPLFFSTSVLCVFVCDPLHLIRSFVLARVAGYSGTQAT